MAYSIQHYFCSFKAGDFERISDHSVNVLESVEELNEKKFLPWDNIVTGTSKDELRRIYITKVKGD